MPAPQEEDILQRVYEKERERAGYYRQLREWERMFNLQAYNDSAEVVLEVKGKEQITRMTPFNIIMLGMRIVPGKFRIEVPSAGPKQKDEMAKGKRERFLQASWRELNRKQQSDLLNDAKFFSLVRGSHIFETKWIEPIMPEKDLGQPLPYMVRVLDPKHVGIHYGPIHPLFAYHMYDEDLIDFVQRYPDAKLDSVTRYGYRGAGSRWSNRSGSYSTSDWNKVRVIDYWWRDKDGSVWFAVLANESFVINPTRTEYPALPFIEGYGDSTPLNNNVSHRRMSILHPLAQSGQWNYENRVSSAVANGMLTNYYPIKKITREMGAAVQDTPEVGPDATLDLPAGVNMEWVNADVNNQLADRVMGMIGGDMQRATFAEISYGEAGSGASGYAISQLSSGSQARMNQVQTNLERSMTHVNSMKLALVEQYAEDGVHIWGRDNTDRSYYHEELLPTDIDGFLANEVYLVGETNEQILQTQVLALRLLEAGVISRQTYRDIYMDIDTPRDEDVRTVIEQALQEDVDLRRKAQLQAYREKFPDDWYEAISQTGLQGIADAELAAKAGPPPPPDIVPPGPVTLPTEGIPAGAGPLGPTAPAAGPGGLPAGAGPQLPPGILPSQQQGLTPEMMGIPPGAPPGVMAELLGQTPPSLEQQLGVPLPPDTGIPEPGLGI